MNRTEAHASSPHCLENNVCIYIYIYIYIKLMHGSKLKLISLNDASTPHVISLRTS
jgi:hypothetical protein